VASMVDKYGQQVVSPAVMPRDHTLKLLISRFVEQLVLCGYTHKEIARDFGRSIPWVKLCLKRATPEAITNGDDT
jgi:hypothetical protein